MTHQGGAGELEVQGGPELLGGASEGRAEGLKGTSGDRAKELDGIGRGLRDSHLGRNRTGKIVWRQPPWPIQENTEFRNGLLGCNWANKGLKDYLFGQYGTGREFRDCSSGLSYGTIVALGVCYMGEMMAGSHTWLDLALHITGFAVGSGFRSSRDLGSLFVVGSGFETAVGLVVWSIGGLAAGAVCTVGASGS